MLNLKNVRDDDLLQQLSHLVGQSRGVEADVVAHIGEAELRRLYAQEACSSMFGYCRQVLGLRENERPTCASPWPVPPERTPSCWTCSATAGST